MSSINLNNCVFSYAIIESLQRLGAPCPKLCHEVVYEEVIGLRGGVFEGTGGTGWRRLDAARGVRVVDVVCGEWCDGGVAGPAFVANRREEERGAKTKALVVALEVGLICHAVKRALAAYTEPVLGVVTGTGV
jgi:hypothetical protein